MPARNDPCPCGSGKKYKQCCLRKDEQVVPPLRLARQTSGGDAHGFDLRDREDVPLTWEADVVAVPVTFGDDPDARPVFAIVAAGELVLAIDLVSRPPAEPEEIAELIAPALAKAREATGREPESVVVRHDLFAEALRADGEVKVELRRELPAIDRAYDDMSRRVLGIPMDEGLQADAARVSRPERWAGWGHPPELIGRLFEAAAAYYRAAPWEGLFDSDVVVAEFTDGRQWALAIMGAAEETMGLAAYESPDDLRAQLEAGDVQTMPALNGAALSLVFDERETMPPATRREIRDAGWEVANRDAYPVLMPMNTPGGGVSRRQLEGLIEVLEGVAAFVKQHPDSFQEWTDAGEALRWTSSAGSVALMYDGPWGIPERPEVPFEVPAELRPACATGSGARPSETFGFGVDLDAAELAQLDLYVEPFKARLAASKKKRGVQRDVRIAQRFCEYMVYRAHAPIAAVSELELRLFVYDDYPQSNASNSEAETALASLERFFAYLAEVHDIQTPWRTEILRDKERFFERWATAPGPDQPPSQVLEWMAALSIDLLNRALLPDLEQLLKEKKVDEAQIEEVEPALLRRWLVLRDAAIAEGVTGAEGVRGWVVGRWGGDDDGENRAEEGRGRNAR